MTKPNMTILIAKTIESFIIWQILTINPRMIYSKEHRKGRKEILKEIKKERRLSSQENK